MKKFKYLLVAFLFFISFSVKATTIDNKTYIFKEGVNCNSNNSVANYISSEDKLIFFNSDTNTYYTLSNNTCSLTEFNDYVKLLNQEQIDYYYHYLGKQVTETRYSKSGFSTGYVLNTDAYNEDEDYYEYDSEYDEYNYVSSEDYDEAKLYTYFVERNFRLIQSSDTSTGTYYTKPSVYGELFTVKTGEITNSDLFSLYEMTTETKDDYKTSEKEYYYDEDTYNNVMSSYGDEYTQTQATLVNNKIVLTLYKYDNTYTTIENTLYFDSEGNEITLFKDSYVVGTDDFIIIKKNDGSVSIYDNKYNAIKSYSYDDKDFFTGLQVDNILVLYFMDDEYNTTTNTITIYSNTEGNDQSYNFNDLTFKFSGSLPLLSEVKVDNKKVDSKYYTLESGSTIITLKKDYLNTLANGNHTITAVYKDGASTSATFKVNYENNPNTSDSIIPSIVIFGISITCIVYILLKNKKA